MIKNSIERYQYQINQGNFLISDEVGQKANASEQNNFSYYSLHVIETFWC